MVHKRVMSAKLRSILNKIGIGRVYKPPYSHFVQLGDPILRCKCDPVSKEQLYTHQFQKLLSKMDKALKRYKCVGVAAPQLGINLRVFAMTFPDQKNFSGSSEEYHIKQMTPYPYTVWVNPSIRVLDYKKIVFPEGCESMRGFLADIARYSKIQLTGWSENGEEKSEVMSGWLARIAQHEMEHLDGQIYLDNANLKSLSCAFWDRVNLHGGKIHLSYYPNKIFSKG